MQIYIVDDEPLILDAMSEAVQKVLPQAEVDSFWRIDEFLDVFRQKPGNVVFLDIGMPLMDGVTLAKRLQAIKEDINIVFVTGYDQYKGAAMDLYASAYLLKPVTEEKLREALRHMRYPLLDSKPRLLETEGIAEDNSVDDRLEVKCFGVFEVFYHGVPFEFQYQKTKELFAYLIDRKGAKIPMRQIICALWEDDGDHVAYYQNLRTDLLKNLQRLPQQVVQASYGSLSVVRKNVNCDYYSFLEHQTKGVYFNEYMEQYSWAEPTKAYLKQMF